MTQYAFIADGKFDGATTCLPNGELVDISDKLGKDGRFETTDSVLADALRGHPAVKEVEATSKSTTQKPAAPTAAGKEA